MVHSFFWVILLLVSSIAEGNVGESYGFGARTASLAGAGAAWGFDSFSAYANPAGLSFAVPEGKRLGLGLSVLYMDPRFTPIENVYVENNYVSDKDRIGNVDTSYRSTFGQTLGLVYQLSESSHWALGLTAFLPISQFAYLDTGEAFIPEYVLYRARTQRPQVNAALGGDLSSAIHVGAGFSLAFSVTANGTVFLNSDPNKPSVMRFSSAMKPKASPYFGVLLTPAERQDAFTLGAVVRFPAIADTTMVLNSGARLFASLAALDFNFTALSALVYDPWTLELGTSWAPISNIRFYGQLDYQLWSKFEAPALRIQAPDITSCKDDSQPASKCGFAISGGKNPGAPYQNIVIARFATELLVNNASFRLGYGYKPSILTENPAGAGNYLDPPRQTLSAGVGYQFKRFLGNEVPARLDLNFAYHFLDTQHITKTSGNEGGDASDYKIGAPGYDAGGKILGGGVSLSLSI